MLEVRRVITAETRDGKSVFARTETVEPVSTGSGAWYGVWGWDQDPSLPCHDAEYTLRSVFPGPGGVRIGVVQYPATEANPAGPGNDSGRFMELLASQDFGHDSLPEPEGMHKTNSIDIIFVLEGEIGLLQPDGGQVQLKPGDVLVQNGAYHAWQPADKPTTVAFVLRATERRQERD
jgi:hypothetical protein